MALTKTKRFFYTKNNLIETVKQLNDKEYLQLPDAGTELTRLIIDKERKQFWLVDQKCFENNCSIITNHHKTELFDLENEDLEKL